MAHSNSLVLYTMLVLPFTLFPSSSSQEDTTQANNNKFSFYINESETKLSVSNSTKTTELANGSSTTTTTVCSCSSNLTDSFLANAQQMMNQMVNKTTMLSKIRHRATHSNEAMWASFTLSGLMMLLVVGVLHSKMWNDRTFLSYTDSQPVKFEQYNHKSEILVKDLIRSRGRNLLSMFTKTKKKKSGNTLKMESFLAGRGDAVDSSHQALLESSDEDFFLESDSESEEETVFKMNSRTGQWEGLEMDETEEMTMSLLGGSRRRRIRTSSSSTDSRFSLLNSSVSKDLVRLSDSDKEEEKQLINVG